jgi:hypothetical protein
MKPQFRSGEISGERQATRTQIVLRDSTARVDSASPNIPGNFGPLAPVFGLMFRCIGAMLLMPLPVGLGELLPLIGQGVALGPAMDAAERDRVGVDPQPQDALALVLAVPLVAAQRAGGIDHTKSAERSAST